MAPCCSRLAAGLAAVLAGLIALRWHALPLPYPCLLPVAPIAPADLPRPVPLQGPFAPNAALRSAVRLFDGTIAGSESVAIAPNGTLVMCDRYGYVWHADALAMAGGRGGGGPLDAPAFSTPRRVAHLGPGRPLGFHHDAAGNLLVCMAGGGGLVRLDGRSGRVEVLAAVAHEPGGGGGGGGGRPPPPPAGRRHPFATPPARALSPILYANDLDIDEADGSVYFTDSAAIPPVLGAGGYVDTLGAYMLSLLQGGKTGRVLRWDPSTGLATVVASGLAYANGIALLPPAVRGAPATHAAVVETNAMRVVRVALTGPGAGRVDPFLTAGLPGFPDGLSRAAGGPAAPPHLWLALVAPPSPLAWALGPRAVRWAAAWAPRPPLGAWGAVVRVDARTGEPVEAFYDLGGAVVSSTSAVTDAGGGRLFLGNLNGAYVSVVDVGGGGGGGRGGGDGGGGAERDEL